MICLRMPGYLMALVLVGMGCSPAVQEDTKLRDRMLTEIVAIYGEPQSDTIISPADGLREYQSGIMRHFSMEQMNQILVREVRWDQGDERAIVWFVNMTGTWRAFNRRVEHR